MGQPGASSESDEPWFPVLIFLAAVASMRQVRLLPVAAKLAELLEIGMPQVRSQESVFYLSPLIA